MWESVITRKNVEKPQFRHKIHTKCGKLWQTLSNTGNLYVQIKNFHNILAKRLIPGAVPQKGPTDRREHPHQTRRP